MPRRQVLACAPMAKPKKGTKDLPRDASRAAAKKKEPDAQEKSAETFILKNADAVVLEDGPYLSARINRRGHSSVGGAQHRACQFKGSHPGNLKVLAESVAATKPGNVADVDEDAGLPALTAHRPRQLFAGQILVADVERDALILDLKWLLLQAASGETAQRDIHHVDEPLKAEWDKFTKGHQMMFVISQ